ncbi:MAG: BrnT family toxin [Dehalococcoidia bacterium]
MNEPQFDWDDANERHIDEHRVTVEEVEEALLDPRRLPAAAHSTSTERRYAAIGTTSGGRILFVAFTTRRGRIRVITAYTAPEWMRRQYRRRR